MSKTIKPGQLVTVNNIVYRCRKLDYAYLGKTCNICDLNRICNTLPFNCELLSNFKRVRRERHQKPEQVSTKNLPKTRRCKRLQNNSL